MENGHSSYMVPGGIRFSDREKPGINHAKRKKNTHSKKGDPDQNCFLPDPGQVAPILGHVFTKNIEYCDKTTDGSISFWHNS